MMQHSTQPLILLPRITPPPSLWRRWVVANALGELVGLGLVAALAGGLVWYCGEPRTSAAVLLFTALMILLGACEGVMLGLAQWLAVHPFLRVLPRCAWVKATTLGAILAWGLGLIPSTLIALQETTISQPPAEISDAAKYTLATLMGLGLGLTLGVPQWMVLRHYVRRAAWWVVANAAAWTVGMPLVFLGADVAPHGANAGLLVLFVALTLLATGAVVGALHGWVLLWLLQARRWSPAKVLPFSAQN